MTTVAEDVDGYVIRTWMKIKATKLPIIYFYVKKHIINYSKMLQTNMWIVESIYCA